MREFAEFLLAVVLSQLAVYALAMAVVAVLVGCFHWFRMVMRWVERKQRQRA